MCRKPYLEVAGGKKQNKIFSRLLQEALANRALPIIEIWMDNWTEAGINNKGAKSRVLRDPKRLTQPYCVSSAKMLKC